ncbi:MAG: helix-turn-helix transcriptional regulator [Anaerolineales bacterium]|jgi:putative transcriptional regulator|nr:MAG: helix-turn-helix transcriptional regulator [Anaerolineales bacterium]
MNDLIVSRIRAARSEKGLTQKDLADYLGKTQATISDLERGKVQVSASELYDIASYLNKPIEYFYGEEIGDKEIQDMIAVLRKTPPEHRRATLEITNMILQMQNISDDVSKYPSSDEIPIEKIQQFYNWFVPFAAAINEMSRTVNEIREGFDKELKLRAIQKPKELKGVKK